MIRQINEEGLLFELLDGKADIFSEKIRAFYRAYGFDYPFCRFYSAGSAVIGSYYGSAVLFGAMEKDKELSLFLRSGAFGELFMSDKDRTLLLPREKAFVSNIMKLNCNGNVFCLSDIDKDAFTENISIGKTYEIIKDGFDIDFDKWYTDTSHNVRHRISDIYLYKDISCAVRLFLSNGISYFSYICTKKDERSKGYASLLLRYAAGRQAAAGADMWLVCEDELREFYEKNGFELSGKAADIKIK